MEQKIKLLIIDNESSTRKVLEHFLNKEFEVTLKNDGMEGMNWLEAGNDPDFIIADLNMPNLNGKEFIKVIRASNLYSENSKERGDAYKTILEKHANEETMTRLLVKAGNALLNADLEQRRYYMGLNNILATLRSMKSDARKNEKDAIIELCKNAMSKGDRFSYDADRTLNRISR